MAFVRGYQNDIFISYSHSDNEPTIQGMPGWVDFFEDLLRKRLRIKRRKAEFKIFRDQQLRRFGKFPEQLSDHIKSSAVFICVLSPNYFESDWCVRELTEFCAIAGSDRIIKIIKTVFDEPGSNDEVKAAYGQIKDILNCEFYTSDETGSPKPLEPELLPKHIPEFIEKIEVVVNNLVMLLDGLVNLQPSHNTEAESEPVEVESPITVYLAETTKDLNKTRDEVRTELLQFNCRVLPAEPLPTEADKLTEQVRDCLKAARLSVHLLGPNYGAIPEMEERSIPHIQFDLAREENRKSALSQLVWTPNGIEITDHRQLQLIETIKNDSTEFLSSRIEDFKTEIHQKLSPDSKNPWGGQSDDGSINVSLFCHEEDMQSVAPLYSYLTVSQFYKVKLPLKDADSFQMHKELLQTSDAVLLYYGTANEDWFVNIWRLIQRQILSGRNKPVLAQAIYAGKPSTTEKSLLESDDPIIIKNFGPFTPQSLTPFIQRIKDGKGGPR